MKVAVAIADLMTGMYSSVAILAALRHRDATGEGQYIDMALLDTQVAWLANLGQGYLTSGELPARLGNAHATVVPYQVFKTADGHIVLAIGNDGQFRKFCDFAGVPVLASDPRFATNPARIRNRSELIPEMTGILAREASAYWIRELERIGVPCGPINDLAEVFADPQVQARGMTIELPHPAAGGKPTRLIANPIKFSDTPISYDRAPPTLGEHTDEVLRELLGLTAPEIADLRTARVI
jgi:crotonobetainyl-CoA:carnitine CoA-transferase CaiB-like acyl-CoA transferase